MKERIASALKNKWTVTYAVGLTSFAAGFGTAYILISRRTQVQLEEIREELKHIEEGYAEAYAEAVTDLENGQVKKDVVLPKVEEVTEVELDNESPVQAFVKTRLNEKLPEGFVQDSGDVPEELVTQSIFEHTNTWNREEELKHRNPRQPYILHKDEFFADEKDYTQTTLSYYVGDDIMCDEDDTPVYNYKDVVGELRFGHGSDDPNVFYVRNDRRRTEYEIVREEGLFSVEVMGLEIENNQRAADLKHSNNRKFRLE